MTAWIIRPMLNGDEDAVRHLFRRCHVGWPTRPARWYVAHPTLVLETAGQVVGVTSFSIAPGATGAMTLHGVDLFVNPDHQAQGYGQALADERLAYGRAVGARMFVGITQEGNGPMTSIFKRQGFHECQRCPGFFHHVRPALDGVAWVGAI